MMRGSLATFGYGSKEMNVAWEIEGAMQVNPKALLVDTRLTPWCSWSTIWQRPTLEEHYGKRYISRGDWLGNVNYAEQALPIQLADEQRGIPWLVRGIEKGFTLILLCGCSNYTTCHRKVIYDKVNAFIGHSLPAYELGQRVLTPCGVGVIDPDVPLDVHRARNRYAVILDLGNPRRYFFPSELKPYDVVQQPFVA